MDASPAINQLTEFVKRKLEQLKEPRYDWQPTVEPPRSFDRSLEPCDPPEWTPPADSIEESRQIIRSAITEYLENEVPVNMLLVKALPGTGKTTAAVEIVDQVAATGKRIAYAGPRHDLFEDVIAKSSNPVEWYEWLPRQAAAPEEDKIQTCNYAGQMADWLVKGYAAMDFCSGVCGWDYVNGGCLYHAQKSRRERVIYIQHQHVTLGHPLSFSVLFGDESPLAAFTNEWRIPARWILPPGMDDRDPMKELLNWLTMYAQSTNRAIMGPDLLQLLGGADLVLDTCEKSELPIAALAYGSIHRAEDVETTPYFHLPQLTRLLIREATQALSGVDYPHRVVIAPGSLTLLLRRTVDYRRIPPHVVWLDATGRPEIYEQIFRRPVQVVDAQPHMHGRIFQVVDRANGKTSLVKSGQRTDKALQAEDLIGKIIEQHGYLQPSVISFKDFVENTDLDVKTSHFYAARGTNEHEDADAIFILGAPQSNIYDIVKLAKMIYFERDTAFKVQWTTQEQVYNYIADDGQGRRYPVSGFWHDSDLQAVLETIREDEIIQAAHRARPVNHPVDIWLLTNIPIPSLPPDELLTMRDVLGSPDGVDIFKWALVQKLMGEKDEITSSDLVEIGISRNTAAKYLDFIAHQPGWEKGVVKISGKRGGRPKAAVIRGGFAQSHLN